jgi:outer membrane protein OmpA-like peptidoglycan-associated protein
MRCGTAIVTTLIAIVLSGVSSAASSPVTRLQDFFSQATVILSEAADPQKARDEIRDLARPLFDGRGAARRALGPEWAARTGGERSEFTRLFGEVFELAYLKMVEARLPRNRPPTVRILGEDPAGARDAVVRTSVEARDGSDVRVDYRMTLMGGVWLVEDVVSNGVSLVENYRAQFARILRTASYADVVARLRAIAADTSLQGSVSAPPGPGSRAAYVVAYFDSGSAKLTTAARTELDTAGAWLTANRGADVLIEGHSDQRGRAELNRALAEERARVVREYLVNRGVDADHVAVVAYGDQRAVCRAPLETCWAQNRRAVVRVTP